MVCQDDAKFSSVDKVGFPIWIASAVLPILPRIMRSAGRSFHESLPGEVLGVLVMNRRPPET